MLSGPGSCINAFSYLSDLLIRVFRDDLIDLIFSAPGHMVEWLRPEAGYFDQFRDLLRLKNVLSRIVDN